MAVQPDCESFGFIVEWYDPQADMVRDYQLTVMVPPRPGVPLEAQMYDLKAKRQFLKRMPIPDLKLAHLQMGSTIMINSRQLRVTSYVDDHTRKAMQAAKGCVTFLTEPTAFMQLGRIISAVEDAGLTICQLRLVSDNGAPVTAVKVAGQDPEQGWDNVMRALPRGCVRTVAEEEAEPYFQDPERFPTTAAFDNCTLAVIRPHAVKAGNVGAILTSVIEAGFEVSAGKMLHLQRAEAKELFEVYQGVLPYFSEVVDSMSSAPCLAFELRRESDVVEAFREICGPHDVDMARHLRPKSLRARFGISNAENAVHATDLEGDAEAEVRYVFQVLAA